MKLQVKTLNQKSLFIEIDDTRTVYELKKELSLYPDVGVSPELQKIIYAGQILTNDNPLSDYNIDVKKFLVVMILKQPVNDSAKIQTQTTTTTTTTTTTVTGTTTSKPEADSHSSASNSENVPPSEPGSNNSKDAVLASGTPSLQPQLSSTPTQNKNTSQNETTNSLVETIVNMGYPEDQVRCALEASFNNPERAIEYLIEGIPTTSVADLGSVSDDELLTTMPPFEVFRSDPLFQNLRRLIRQNPDLINEAIQSIGETNPALLNLIDENQQEFLNMLIEGGDEDDDDDDDDDDEDDNDESEDVI